MKITRRQLQRIIREEVKRITEIQQPKVIRGLTKLFSDQGIPRKQHDTLRSYLETLYNEGFPDYEEENLVAELEGSLGIEKFNELTKLGLKLVTQAWRRADARAFDDAKADHRARDGFTPPWADDPPF